MSYVSRRQEGRLVLIPYLRDAFAGLRVLDAPPGSETVELAGADPLTVHRVDEIGVESDCELYNFPFIFKENGKPWHEANDYLLTLMRDRSPVNRRTDEVRRRAGKLLDYLIFCEKNNIDWMDFSGSRPSLRPTYKYFYYLVNESQRSNQVINQYTACVYNFYSYVSEYWHKLDMKRVDTIKKVRVVIKNSRGGRIIDAQKRSQTRRAPPVSSIPLGFLREDGEDLRPLTNSELGVFMETIGYVRNWSAVERLILLTSLMTGARKQTVLTLRLRHLKGFTKDKLLPEGAYKLHAGPRTGIDTKFDKPLEIYFPRQLAEELSVLAGSPVMKRRRAKLRARLELENTGVSLKEEDMYLFLSDQGNCYYMAKDDSRYLKIRSPQTGQVTETLKRKLLAAAPAIFPKDFSYHWLRATYAFQLYQRLQGAIDNGLMTSGEVIGFIQNRLHHESRETTESYLKLFKMTQQKTTAQECWEEILFSNSDYSVLKVVNKDE